MFSEEFNKMVTEPAQLQDIPLGDIRVIAERYPYCQAAQIMLAKKLHLLDSPLFEQQLKVAAIAAFDREQLFHFIHQPVVSAVMAEHEETAPPEVIEPERLKVVEEPQQEQPVADEEIVPAFDREETTLHEAEAEAILHEMIESIPEITHHEEEAINPVEDIPIYSREEERIEADAMLQEETMTENLEHAAEPEIIDQIEQQESGFPDELTDLEREQLFDLPAYDIERELGVLDDADKFTLPPIPPEVAAEVNTEVYTDTFSGWLQRLGGASSGKIVEQKASNAPVRVYLRKQPAPGEDQATGTADRLMNEQFAAELARKSIQADDGIISETYARILVMQGKFARAIEMYNRLSLLKPQKSDYFAALIDQIKKKIR